jgi:sugar phosphate permease
MQFSAGTNGIEAQTMTLSATQDPRNIPRRRWGIALLLGFGVPVNYIDRVNLSVSKDALHNAFGISTVTFGYLLSACS